MYYLSGYSNLELKYYYIQDANTAKTVTIYHAEVGKHMFRAHTTILNFGGEGPPRLLWEFKYSGDFFTSEFQGKSKRE